MGCWHGTCMVSKLPILSNEKIKLVVLLPFGYGCNSNYLLPCLLPISGEYNDYGGIKNIKQDENYHIVLKSFKEYFGDVISFDNNKPIVDSKLEDIINKLGTIDYFKLNDFDKKVRELYNVKIIEDGELRNSRFSTVMIREDIWDFIIDNYSQSKNTIERFKISYNLALETYNRKKERQNKTLEDIVPSFRYLLKTSSFINDYYYFEAMINNNNDIKNQWLEFMIVSAFIESIRTEWVIPAGEGSQHTGFENYKMLSQKIIEICDGYENKKNN